MVNSGRRSGVDSFILLRRMADSFVYFYRNVVQQYSHGGKICEVIVPYIKKHVRPIVKPCGHCGDLIELRKSGWAVKYPACSKPECQAAKKAAEKERNRQAVRATYKKHGGAGKYKAQTHTRHESDEVALPRQVDPPPKCATESCKNKAHRAYGGVVQYTHCKRCLRKINARARAVEASWFPEANMYY